MIFSAVGKILVLANAFFYSNSKKRIENWFFNLWQDLGFGECFFSIQILIEKRLGKLIFSAFGKILVLAVAFFYSNSNEKVLGNCYALLSLLAANPTLNSSKHSGQVWANLKWKGRAVCFTTVGNWRERIAWTIVEQSWPVRSWRSWKMVWKWWNWLTKALEKAQPLDALHWSLCKRGHALTLRPLWKRKYLRKREPNLEGWRRKAMVRPRIPVVSIQCGIGMKVKPPHPKHLQSYMQVQSKGQGKEFSKSLQTCKPWRGLLLWKGRWGSWYGKRPGARQEKKRKAKGREGKSLFKHGSIF